MDEDIYDEFGNLLQGSNISDSDDESDYDSFQRINPVEELDSDNNLDLSDSEQQGQEQQLTILQEDKRHYSTLSKTFGPDVEVSYQTQDTQSLETPLVKPSSEASTSNTFNTYKDHTPPTAYDKQYLKDTLLIPARNHTVVLLGSLNSGKTTVIDHLVRQTHPRLSVSSVKNGNKRLRYTDMTTQEIQRGISLRSSVMSLLLPSSYDGQSGNQVCHVVDTPGHSDFLDEVSVGIRAVDNNNNNNNNNNTGVCMLTIDVIEGLTHTTKHILDKIIKNRLRVCLLLNKIDRFCLELRIGARDAFGKIRDVIDEVNLYVLNRIKYYHGEECKDKETFSLFDPRKGNVVFGMAEFGVLFTLQSFALLHFSSVDGTNNEMIEGFAQRLWGDIYYDSTTNKFSKTQSVAGNVPTFVHFILEPLYKIITMCLTRDEDQLKALTWKYFQIPLKNTVLKGDPQVVLKSIISMIFQNSSIPSFVQALITAKPLTTETKLATPIQNKSGILTATILKMETPTTALIKVHSGQLQTGMKIRILDEAYDSVDNDEAQDQMTVKSLRLSCGRYSIPVDKVGEGNLVLLDDVICCSKTGLIIGFDHDYENLSVERFNFISPVFKVVIEPRNPSELPKLLEGLRIINKKYPGIEIVVEDSGEHVLFGHGEMYLDCVLYDLREITKIDINVSDPITKFVETVSDVSMVRIPLKSANGENEITIIAEPMEQELSNDIQTGKFKFDTLTQRQQAKILRSEYQWDSLSSRSVLAHHTTNVLLNDTIPDSSSTTDLISRLIPVLNQAFQYSITEGPLTHSSIHGTKFKIIDLKISSDPILSSIGQLIPMIRKACHVALMISKPRLMEPYYTKEIITNTTSSSKRVIEKILDRRRGVIIGTRLVPATTLTKYVISVPVIDSVGLETDLRTISNALITSSIFENVWRYVPGDPLDKEIVIPKLKMAVGDGMARDFVNKTRKRKGIQEDVGIGAYLMDQDDEILDMLKELDLF